MVGTSIRVFILVYAIVGFTKATPSFLELQEHFCPSCRPDCLPHFHRWVISKSFANIQDTFLQNENTLQTSCNNADTKSPLDFVIRGDFVEPNVCNKLVICNTTNCLVMPGEALMYVYRVSTSCVKNTTANDRHAFFVVNSDGQANSRFKYLNQADYNLLTEPIGQTLHRNNYFENVTIDAYFGSDVYHSVSARCSGAQSHPYNTLLLEGIGDLPSKCTNISICNDLECFRFPKVSLKLSYMISRGELKRSWGLDIPPMCRVSYYNRLVQRHAIPVYDDISKSEIPPDAINNANKKLLLGGFGILNFNLPGYRYCGPGTDIEEMDNLGGPVNDLDAACREHDVDYLLGVHPEDADEKLLNKLWKLKHPLLPLFMSVFEAKRYFEHFSGKEYTSSLYYVPNEYRSSITFYLAESSAYDSTEVKIPISEKGRTMDNKWKNILHDIWRGYCFTNMIGNVVQTPPNADMENTDSGSNELPRGNLNSRSTPPPMQPAMDTGDEGNSPNQQDSTNTDESPSTIPKPPSHFKGCRIIISEVVPRNELKNSFIELRQVCPRGTTKSTYESLRGYVLLVVQVGDPSYIVLAVSLSSQKLNSQLETTTGRQKHRNYYFVVGNKYTPNCNLPLDKISMIAQPQDDMRSIPGQESTTYAAVLLYMRRTERDRANLQFLKMSKCEHNGFLPRQIGDTQRELIKEYMQDIVVYGAACPMLGCGEVLHWQRQPPQVVPSDVYVPLPYVEIRPNSQQLGLSQCSDNSLPMQNNDFVIAAVTPGRRNACPPPGATDLISLHGKSLQSTAQKLVYNTHQFFLRYSIDRKILPGFPVELTSKAVGISEMKVYQILANCKSGTIVTPGKKRSRIQPVQCQFDGFYSDMVKRIIQRFYAENKPPFVGDIFEEFKRQVEETEVVRRQQNEVFVPFHCGEQTFRKVLHKLGFKYGEIDYRSVILMRPDIVERRGKYLNEMRLNRALPEPLPVVFLDETWIDPHARSGKAWVLRNPKAYRESALYSYKKHKISRGPRIIVLSAGGSNGMIHGATDVFMVSKKDASGDYHDNVNGEYFLRWFTNLLDELDKTGKKHIIVMDNAPYHGTTDLPKQKDKKVVIYNWLKENLPPHEAANMLHFDIYRKWQLWAMVQQAKSTRSYYKIDRMAEQRGHRILRLPPYNCDLNPIEFVWKDIKDAVRKLNFNQKLETVMSIAKQVLKDYTVDQWKKHIDHVMKLEDKYWTDDGFYDTFLDSQEKLVITTDDDADEEDDIVMEPPHPDVLHSLVHEEEYINNFSFDDEEEEYVQDVELNS